MSCPATAPDTDIACTREDDPAAHPDNVHSAATPDGQGVTAWGVELADHERWDTEPPKQLLDWIADAERAEETANEEPAPAQ